MEEYRDRAADTEWLLRESEDRYRMLVESIDAIPWEFDVAADRWTYVAPQAGRILGYAPSEWTDRAWWLGRIPAEWRQWAAGFLASALVKGSNRSFEYPFTAKNGEVRWLSDVIQVELRDEAPVRLRGVMIDISKRRHTEQRLERQLMFDSALVDLLRPMIASDLTLGQVAELVLERARYLTGSGNGYVSSVDPATGENIAHAFTAGREVSWSGAIRENERLAFRRNGDGRYPGLYGHSLNTRIPFFTNDPSTHPAASGLQDDAGLPRRVLSVPVLLNRELVGQILLADSGRDYHADDLAAVKRLAEYYSLAIHRHRADSSVRESEHRLRNMLENVELLAVILDADGNILFANNYLLSVTGWQRDEVIGCNWFSRFIPPGEGVEDIFLRAIRTGEVDAHVENCILTRSGAKRAIVWNNTVLRNPQGIVYGTTSIGIDVTEHRKMEEQLRHAQKMEAVGTLAGGMAHDFNNILTAISGYAHLIEMDTPPGSEQQSYVNDLINAIDRAANLTQSLLAFSRKREIEVRPLDANEIVTGLEKILSRVIGEHITFTVQPAKGTLPVCADKGQLEQALMNLAINSRDAMPDGGRLTISTASTEIGEAEAGGCGVGRAGSYCMIVLEDTGIGMTPEVLEHIFEPFFTTKEVGKGTGLGLSMAYAIVQKHHGAITATSSPGRGTTFRIYLPLLHAAVTSVQAPGRRDVLLRGTETVLLVEDDFDVRDLMRRVLGSYGYTVVPAQDGVEALALFRQNSERIGLVVTDVIMPGKNGLQLYQDIRELRPGVPVLFMSGYTGDVLAEKGFRSDYHFIAKPVAPADMLRAVRKALNSDRPPRQADA